MADSNSGCSCGGGGISFSGALGLLFIGLKLGNVIDWSWWWVLAPLWIPIVLGLAALAFFVSAAILAGIMESK